MPPLPPQEPKVLAKEKEPRAEGPKLKLGRGYEKLLPLLAHEKEGRCAMGSGRPARESSDELGGGGGSVKEDEEEGKPRAGRVRPMAPPSPYPKGGKEYVNSLGRGTLELRRCLQWPCSLPRGIGSEYGEPEPEPEVSELAREEEGGEEALCDG
jgi:hypothetical protein